MGSVYTRADMVSITYVNKDTLDKYGWKEVIINKRIIMRYDISKDFYNNVLCDRDGYQMNLVYPPTESYLESDGFDIFEPSTQ